MKKVLACVIIVAFLVGVSGCASNSFLCLHKDQVLSGLQLVIDQANSTIAAIESAYPGVMPGIVLAALQAAQTAKAMAEVAANKACPSTTDLNEAQSQMTFTNQLVIMGVMTGAYRK